MGRKTTHVVPGDGGGWDVKQGGADRASRHFDVKQDAVNWGRENSRRNNSEFYIHGKDGKIQEKDSHGGDSFPPRG